MNDTSFDILIGLLHGPKHGYALLQDIEALHNGRYTPGPGLLYTNIRKLLDIGVGQIHGAYSFIKVTKDDEVSCKLFRQYLLSFLKESEM